MSCSHGAGRKMGRNTSRKALDLSDELQKLEEAGNLVNTLRGVKQLDEAPGAYKDIDVVMENQKDLVKIITKLKPLATVKG